MATQLEYRIKPKSASKPFLFLEMIRFEHSIFALPFAYIGLLLASQGWPSAKSFWGVTGAMVSFRTMAMGLNRLIDHSIDALNPRTSNRALPAGNLKRSYVWFWTAASFAAFEIFAFWLHPLCLKLSWIPVALAAIYPYLKRISWLSHSVLGLVLGIAPAGAWVAVRGNLSGAPIWMSLGVMFWVTGFDILYAIQDMTFDRRHGLFSFPACFGLQASLIMTRLLHVLTVWMWFAAGQEASLGWPYFVGLALVMAFLLKEHFLVELFGTDRMQEAFFNMNAGISLVVFFSVLLDFGIRGVFQ